MDKIVRRNCIIDNASFYDLLIILDKSRDFSIENNISIGNKIISTLSILILIAHIDRIFWNLPFGLHLCSGFET